MTNTSPRAYSEFTGIPYAAADCIDLLFDAQRRLFGRTFPDVYQHADRNQWRRKAQEYIRDYTVKVDVPQPGDLVLMKDFGQRYPHHVGTYFELAGDGWVLHTTERTDSVFHRVRQISNYSIAIEGYYRWKTP